MKRAKVMGLMVFCGSLSAYAETVGLDYVTVETSDMSVYWGVTKDKKNAYFYCDNTKTFCENGFTVTPKSGWRLVTPSAVTVAHGSHMEWEVMSINSEDTESGKIYLRDFYMEADVMGQKSEFSPNILVPEGTQVTYKAKQGSGEIGSAWVVQNGGTIQTQANSSYIPFTLAFWGAGTGWFGNPATLNTPQKGVYTISAKPNNEPNLPLMPSHSAKMDVVIGSFIQHPNDTGNTLVNGFDDYTNWEIKQGQTEAEKSADYYGARKGRCKLPCASIFTGDVFGFYFDGIIALEFSGASSPLRHPISLTTDKPLTLKCEETAVTEAFSTVTLQSLRQSGNWISPRIKAETNGLVFAELNAHSYEPKVMTSCLFVRVGREHASKPGEYVYPNEPPSTIRTTLNMIFRQGGREFGGLMNTIKFPFSAHPLNDIWSDTAREALKVDFTAKVLDQNNYRHIVFLLLGVDKEDNMIRGRGDWPGRFSWIFSRSLSSYFLPTIGHEIGHNLGLDEEYDVLDRTSGPDKDNLMNNTDRPSTRFRLRKHQWETVNADQGKNMR